MRERACSARKNGLYFIARSTNFEEKIEGHEQATKKPALFATTWAITYSLVVAQPIRTQH